MSDKATVVITGDNTRLKAALAQSQVILTTFARNVVGSFSGLALFGGLTAGLLGTAAAVAGLTHFMTSSVHGYEEAEEALLRLDAVLEGVGNRSGFTRSKLIEMSQELQRTTVYSDEAALAAETAFIKMENISGGVFERALKASADLAATMKTTLPGAAETLARALQSPEKGMLRLRRAGIMLSEDEKKRVKELMAQNKLIEAQAVILDVVERKTHNLATTLGTTLTGEFQKLANQWGEFKEEVGEVLEPFMRDVIPVLKATMQGLQILAGLFSELWEIAHWVLGGILDLFMNIPIAISKANDALEEMFYNFDKMALGGLLEWLGIQDMKPKPKPANEDWIPIGSTYEERELQRKKREADKKKEKDAKDKGEQLPPKGASGGKDSGSLAGTVEGLEELWKRIVRKDTSDPTLDALEDGNEIGADGLAEAEKQTGELLAQTGLLTEIRDKLRISAGGNLANA